MLDELKEEGLIYEWSDTIRYKAISLKKYLLSLEDTREKAFFHQRVNGQILEEIGMKNNITRERVRQVVEGFINSMPTLYEDRYKAIFSKYNFSEDSFTEVFNEAKSVYQYLDYRFVRG